MQNKQVLWEKGSSKVLFAVLSLEMQTLCLVATRRRDWKPKGNCWLCAEIWLTLVNNSLAANVLVLHLHLPAEIAVVVSLMHITSNYISW